ncbi:MAG: hypothetical protein M0Q12_03080 [Synergistaceae bacterium]|jgi:hypothetical protein|nr:hypothetical protein [Synergistaceae bacterium]
MGNGEAVGDCGCGGRYGYRWEQVEGWDVCDDRTTGGSRLKVGVWLRCGLKGDVARNRSWKMGFTIGKAKTAGEDLG